MQFVVFDVRADLAQFKKPFTTMSPLTFAIPTGTASIGLIAAIIGLDKDKYWKFFPYNSYHLSIGVKKPIKKVVIPINTLKTTLRSHFRRFEEHKRTNMEFLKECEFRFWFWSANQDIFDRLVSYLKEHNSYYTPSLGLAWNIANFDFVGVFESKVVQNDQFVELNSILRKDLAIEVNFSDRQVFSIKMPVYMRTDNSRVVDCYADYLYEISGRGLIVKVEKYYLLENGDKIVPI